jgi:hypothetical protein
VIAPERVRRVAVHVRAAGGSDEEGRRREGRGHRRRRRGPRRRARRRVPGGGAEDRLRDAGEVEAGPGPDRAPVGDLAPEHRASWASSSNALLLILRAGSGPARPDPSTTCFRAVLGLYFMT